MFGHNICFKVVWKTIPKLFLLPLFFLDHWSGDLIMVCTDQGSLLAENLHGIRNTGRYFAINLSRPATDKNIRK